ncbi:MAG: carbon storage regulator [Planctomycetales bacterium]
MLVLSRKIGEKICIDGDITLTVLGIQGNRIRLGIVAPETHSIQRSEILERRKEFEISIPADPEFVSHIGSH